MNKGLGRRAFLGALGATGVLAGLSEGRARTSALVSGNGKSGRPLRFIGIYTPHGRAHELWQPRANFQIHYPESSLGPFDDVGSYGRSFRDQLVVIDGVDLSAGIEVGTTGHDGPRAIFTGSGANGKNASIDQFLAFECGLGAETPHTALALGVGSDQSDIGSSVSYAAGGTPVPKWIDPAQTFAELFGSSLGGQRAEQLARDRARGKSVLDVVRQDLKELSARAPASERQKIEQHQHALREIEKRLGGYGRSCDAPEPPDQRSFPKWRSYGGGEPYLDAVTDLQIDLLARAFACDLSRFATLFLADLSRTNRYPDLPSDVHADVAHRYDARTERHPGTPKTWQALATQNRYTYGKVARLLSRLAEAGVLEDTLVYVSSDMGDPARHSSRGVPTLIAGGAGGHFRLGRYLDFRGAAGGGIPNNRVLVSICHAFGVPTPRFGQARDASIVTGRLDDLHTS